MHLKYNAYLASGWFSDEQRQSKSNIKQVCHELGLCVFDPEAEDLCSAESSLDTQSQIFTGNLEAISNSEFVIVNTSGKDMGTIFEAGYSYKSMKPIVYYCEGLTGNFNLMLAQSGSCVATTPEELRVHLLGIRADSKYWRSYNGKIE